MHTLIKSLALASYICAAIWLVTPSIMTNPATSAALQSNSPQSAPSTAQCPGAKESSLPLPSSLSPDDVHDKLLAFLQNTEYVKLNWCVDVRDTGPYVNTMYLGVHPVARIYCPRS